MSLAVLADHMASKGRGPDSMLIHMSPREVQGLQALAENHGGSLTINPETGLPEAGFLDKLLPAIIGFALAPMTAGTSLAFLGATPMASALTVGGLQTLRTGDIGKGIQAGLGAYGGASLGANLASAGTGAISSEVGGEALKAAGLTGEAALTAEADQVVQRAVGEKLAAATPYETLSAGADVVKNNPMKYLKANAMPLASAFGPAILAGESAESNMPKTTTGMIAPYSFDPYSGTYTAANRYPASPNRAAGGGLMGLAAGGIAGYGDGDDVPRQNGMAQGGIYDFAQRSEPVVRMAEGGDVQRFAIGDLVKADIDKAYAAGDYGKVNELAQANKITAEDVASTYKGFDTSGLAGLGINLFTPAAAQAAATPTYTQYSDEAFGAHLAKYPNANLAEDLVTYNADPAAFNRYIASLTSPFVGATESGRGSGTFGIYNEFVGKGISPDEYYAAAIANDPKYGGWTKDMIQEGYNLNKGMYALSDAKKGVVTDTDWAKLMVGNGTWDNPQYDPNEMAQATGLSIAEVRARYELEKAKANPIIKTVTNTVTGTGTGGTNVIGTGGIGTGGIGAGTGVSLGTATNLSPGVSGGGNTYVNANGTITTRPDFSLPMRDVRDAYTTGGGSLGFESYVPKTIEEFDTKYGSRLTGGSKQSLDYLTGKTKYSPTPYTPTGEVMKPYAESVLGVPMASSKKMYLFDPTTKQYKINPDYAIPTYDKDGKKSLNLTNQDVINYVKSPEYSNDDTFVSWMTANNLSPEQVAAATGMSIADVYKKIKKAKPVETVADTAVTGQNDGGGGGGGEANGGLMAMARGGMSQQFNLGDYSDGGRLLRGPGDGVSDSIPASIGGKRPARLADGEFVVPARIVSELGNGSTEAGARKLYAMMDRIQKARRSTVGKGRVAKNSRSEKYLPA